MPFFYSQYLKDEKQKATNGASKAPSSGQRRPASNAPRNRSLTKPSSLIWHSGYGASGITGKKSNPRKYKPLKYNHGDGPKVVHFSTIEVQPFHFDWTAAGDYFYTRAELSAMGQKRFDDAAKLRQQRRLDESSTDDVNISTKPKFKDISTLLDTALGDADGDDTVSIRGIEHFVYPDLQQEMIRKKKQVQREVLEFVRSKRPDPQGWRLAQHSRGFSQWARNVALDKGMKYYMNNVAMDPELTLSKDEHVRVQKSQDELDQSSRCLKGSSSFSRDSTSFDAEDASIPRSPSSLQGIAEGNSKEEGGGDADESEEVVNSVLRGGMVAQTVKKGEGLDDSLDESQVSQPPGDDTGEE